MALTPCLQELLQVVPEMPEGWAATTPNFHTSFFASGAGSLYGSPSIPTFRADFLRNTSKIVQI
jgi:hypothetical protein